MIDVEATTAIESVDDIAKARAEEQRRALAYAQAADPQVGVTHEAFSDPDLQLPAAAAAVPKQTSKCSVWAPVKWVWWLCKWVWWFCKWCACAVLRPLALFMCGRFMFTKWTVPRHGDKRRDWPRMRVFWNTRVFHSLPADVWDFTWHSLHRITEEGFDTWWTEGLALMAVTRRRGDDDCNDNAAAKSALRAREPHEFMRIAPRIYVGSHPIRSTLAVIAYLLLLALLALSARYTIREGGFALGLLTRGGSVAPMTALTRALGLRSVPLVPDTLMMRQELVRPRDRAYVEQLRATNDRLPELVAWNVTAWGNKPCERIDVVKLYASDSRQSAALTLFYNASVAYWVTGGYTAFTARHFGLDYCMTLIMCPPETPTTLMFEPLLLLNAVIEAPQNATVKTLNETSTLWAGVRQYARPTVATYFGICVDGDAAADTWGAITRPACNGTLRASAAWQMHGLASVLRGLPAENEV